MQEKLEKVFVHFTISDAADMWLRFTISRSRVCNEKKVLDVQEIASVLDLKIDNEKKVLDVLPN